MTKEQIENAAKEHQSKLPYCDDRKVRGEFVGNYYGFIAGAQWRINSVWHDASEKPDKNQLVLFECRKTYGKGYSVNFGENYELMKNVIVRWAYIIDLLPERKEEAE